MEVLLRHKADPQALIPAASADYAPGSAAGPSSAATPAAKKGRKGGQNPSQQQQQQQQQQGAGLPARELQSGTLSEARDQWLREDLPTLSGGNALHLAARAHLLMPDSKVTLNCLKPPGLTLF
jgi:hypothetical protein